MMDQQQLEKYSSAFTLSDMEIFIFPELLYALVLANIMSPEIWKWRNDKWFSGIEKMGPLKKIHRLKQYIMDHYSFNLDLETWGLTDKQAEINRFRDFIDEETLQRSNALFGYEGDKYYFDIDIRKHFGLDKFDSDIIPYWKTETLEAMNAFRLKEGHQTGAGECVSLACLYAAALFVVAGVQLEKIFLMGTPLHSQNFILVDDGVLTNNRRIVTKTMWYNGTELSTLARRALEHEKVTMVAHNTGYIHSIYPEATINEDLYNNFREKLSKYLEAPVSFEIFINFLRVHHRYQKLFEFSFTEGSTTRYIYMEKAFGYEHTSKNQLGGKTEGKLFNEIDEEDLTNQPTEDRIVIAAGEKSFKCRDIHECLALLREMHPELSRKSSFFDDLKKFLHTIPSLPSPNKYYNPQVPVSLSRSQTREEIIAYLSGIRKFSTVADLSFYAGRYMDSCDWQPFLKAAFERNPVSIDYFKDMEIEKIHAILTEWPDESIYEGNRPSLPDEVVNYRRGDGLEKAITLLNVAKALHLDTSLEQQGERIVIRTADRKFEFHSAKKLRIPSIHF
jgi:hypothetical protein